jgi:glycosyltransferase involved in cell wall biosynthesis
MSRSVPGAKAVVPGTGISATPARRPRRAAAPRFREGWLHLCNGLDPARDGGMVPSILGMTGALAQHETPVTIVTPTPSRLGATELPPRVTLRGPETGLEAVIRSAEVVHMHGLWQTQTRRGARVARAAGVPYVIAAHGMAEPWALRQKAWKKKLYTALVEGNNLRRAACLHALSRPEIGHLRALAPGTPVCFVPNGVDLAPLDDLPPRAELEAEFPELAGKFLLLFYGRLHAKKGLDLLAHAWDILRREHPDLHLVLAGKDDGALAPLLRRLGDAGLSSRVTWLGHVDGPRARRVWGAADAFVLSSYSEGFSMAILEALACRLPVLVTTACHFPELAAAEAGIVVEPTPEAVTEGLRRLLESSPAERAELGRKGRALVERDYTWEQQAQRLVTVYRWLAGGGPVPAEVLL